MFTHAWSKAVLTLLRFYRMKSHSLPLAGKLAPVEKSSYFTYDFHTPHIDPHILVKALASAGLQGSLEILK